MTKLLCSEGVPKDSIALFKQAQDSDKTIAIEINFTAAFGEAIEAIIFNIVHLKIFYLSHFARFIITFLL